MPKLIMTTIDLVPNTKLRLRIGSPITELLKKLQTRTSIQKVKFTRGLSVKKAMINIDGSVQRPISLLSTDPNNASLTKIELRNLQFINMLREQGNVSSHTGAGYDLTTLNNEPIQVIPGQDSTRNNRPPLTSHKAARLRRPKLPSRESTPRSTGPLWD